MYERFRKEKIVEAKIQRLRNAMGVMDTIVTFQNGAWHAQHAGCYRKFQDGADLEIDGEQFLFFFRFSESRASARDRRIRETRETRAAAVSLAPSVTSVAICVSRVLLDGLRKKERLLVV